MLSLIGLITLGFSLLGSTGASEDTLATDSTNFHSQGLAAGSATGRHVLLDIDSSTSESKPHLEGRRKLLMRRGKLLMRGMEGDEDEDTNVQALIKQAEGHSHSAGMSMVRAMSKSSPAAKLSNQNEWWNGGGPTPDMAKNLRSRTVMAVYISDQNELQLTASEHSTVHLTESSGENCRWMLSDTGEGLGHAYIQKPGGDGNEYLCDHSGDVVMDYQKCPWQVIPSASGHVKLKSILTKNFMQVRTGSSQVHTDATGGNDCDLRVTIISVGWGKHHDVSLVSPTSLQVYLATDGGHHLRDNGGQPAFKPNNSIAFDESESWHMIDAGSGWSFLRNVESKKYLADESGTLKLKDWDGSLTMDDDKKWWFVEMPAAYLAKNLLSSQRKDEVEDVDGVPEMVVRFAGNDTKRWIPIDTDDWAGTKKFQLILKNITWQVDE